MNKMNVEIIKKLKDNFIFQLTYFSSYVPSMQILKNDVVILCTDISDDTFNVVVDAHFSKENALERIKDVKKIFEKKRLPFSWWIGPGDEPENLKSLLISNGFSLKEKDYGMYLELKEFFPKTAEKLTINQVVTTEGMKEFDQVLLSSFGNPDAFKVVYRNIPLDAFGNNAPFRFFVGYVNKIAVTTGILVLHAGVAGVYYIVTKKDERRKGYATEMMHFLLEQAIKEKIEFAILQASQVGKKVYEKMGFLPCCQFEEFSLNIS